jgi:hypothetical protein
MASARSWFAHPVVLTNDREVMLGGFGCNGTTFVINPSMVQEGASRSPICYVGNWSSRTPPRFALASRPGGFAKSPPGRAEHHATLRPILSRKSSGCQSGAKCSKHTLIFNEILPFLGNCEICRPP